MNITAIAKTAGVRKRIYPHLFRHSAATRLASFLTEAQMKAYFGWVQNSNMAATYIHMSGKDVDNGILNMHNKPIEKEKVEIRTAPQMCKRCGKQNAHDAVLCQYCGLSFDKERAKSDMLSMQQQLEATRSELREMTKKQEAQKKGMESLAKKLAAITVEHIKRGSKAAVDEKG